MLKSSTYIYLVSRVHGLSTRLMSRGELESLSKTQNFASFLETLSGEEYVRRLSSIQGEEVDARLASRVFADVYVDRLVHLVRITSGKYRDFLLSFLKRVEIENIKRVLRAKMGGRDISVEVLLPLPREFTSVNFNDLVNVKSLDDVQFHLTPTIYRGASEAFQIAKNMVSTYPVELILENIYFLNLLASASKLPSSKKVVDLIRNEYASTVVFNILAIKFLDAPLTIFEKYSRQISKGMGVSSDYVNDLLRAREDTFSSLLRASRFAWISANIEDGIESRDVAELYNSIKRGFRIYYESVSRRDPLGITYLLWYLYTVEYEYLNLSLIATAKELGLKPEEIKLY